MSRLALLSMTAAVMLSGCMSDHDPGSSYYRDGYYGRGYAGNGYYHGSDYGGSRYRVVDSYRYDTGYRPPRVRPLPLLRPVRPSRR